MRKLIIGVAILLIATQFSFAERRKPGHFHFYAWANHAYKGDEIYKTFHLLVYNSSGRSEERYINIQIKNNKDCYYAVKFNSGALQGSLFRVKILPRSFVYFNYVYQLRHGVSAEAASCDAEFRILDNKKLLWSAPFPYAEKNFNLFKEVNSEFPIAAERDRLSGSDYIVVLTNPERSSGITLCRSEKLKGGDAGSVVESRSEGGFDVFSMEYRPASTAHENVCVIPSLKSSSSTPSKIELKVPQPSLFEGVKARF